ncbi:hypothetical protein ACFE04_028242 [Oxalis oulophora]
MWEPLFGKQQFPSSLELVVMDSDGTRMWCTVPQLMIKSDKMKQNTSIIATTDHEFPPTQFDIRKTPQAVHKCSAGDLSSDDGDASSQLITTVSSTQSETLVDDLMSSLVRSIDEFLTLEDRNGVTWDAENVQRVLEKMATGFIVGGDERYVVEINVVDSTAPISVTIWDRECFQIYGKTTKEMRKLSFRNQYEILSLKIAHRQNGCSPAHQWMMIVITLLLQRFQGSLSRWRSKSIAWV